MHQIYLVTSDFYPIPTGIAVYTSDLAKVLADNQFNVTVITSRNQENMSKSLSLTYDGEIEIINRINVVSFKNSFQGKPGLFNRILAELVFFTKGFFSVRKLRNKNCVLVCATIPFVSCGLIAKFLSRRLQVPGVVIVQDISSLALIESGIPKGKWFFWLGKTFESLAVSWASRLVAISEDIAKYLIGVVKDKSKVELVPNYSTLELPNLKRSESRLKFGFRENDFVVTYAGSFGYKQGFTNLLSAAEFLTDDMDIRIICVGGGHQERFLSERAKFLTNVSIVPPVPTEDLPNLLSASDLLLLTERTTVLSMSLPSKLTAYFSANRPVIAAINMMGATSKMVGEFMYVVAPDDPRALSQGIRLLKSDPTLRANLANSARNYAQENMSADLGRRKYLEIVSSLISNLPYKKS